MQSQRCISYYRQVPSWLRQGQQSHARSLAVRQIAAARFHLSRFQAAELTSDETSGQGRKYRSNIQAIGKDAPQEPASNPKKSAEYVGKGERLQRRQASIKRIKKLSIGVGVCFAIQLAILLYAKRIEKRKVAEEAEKAGSLWPEFTKPQLDSTADPSAFDGKAAVVQKPGDPNVKLDPAGNELLDTGTSTIPHFPRLIHLQSYSPDPASQTSSSETAQPTASNEEEYTLVGLGIRTVSFLSIQVYVLGLYVRTSDLGKLQEAFVKYYNPIGSALIPSEKEQLRKDLTEKNQKSMDIWEKLLRETGIRSAIRIVPTRNTDFNHLRDGWIRGITNRTQEVAQRVKASESSKGSDDGPKLINDYEDETFGASVNAFKALFGGKGKAPKGSIVVLTRDERGALGVIYERKGEGQEYKGEEQGPKSERGERQFFGSIPDERVSRLVWLGYLGGKDVASEAARRSITDGVLELVERPLGTVGARVV